MAVEVIRRKLKVVEQPREIDCECGATLRYLRSDARDRHVYSRGDDYEVVRRITCPNCQCEVRVP